MKKLYIVSLLVLLITILPASEAFSAMGELNRFTLSDATDKDFAGAGSSIVKDGKPDAEFSVRISGSGAISGFSLRNLTSGKEWNTSGGSNVLVVVDNKGAIVNNSFPRVTFILAADYRLYANDRVAITAGGGEFELTVRFIDNSRATARTTIEPTITDQRSRLGDRGRGWEAAGQTTTSVAGSAKIITSSFRGKGRYDLTNESKRLGSNINPDYQIDVSIAGSDTLTGVRIRATGGNVPDRIWDTTPTTNNMLIAVTEQGKNSPLNSSNGSISIPIKEFRDLSFWFDGDDAVARQDFRVTLLYSGGRIEEIDIKQTAATQGRPGPAQGERGPGPAQGDRGPGRGGRRSVQMLTRPVEIKLDVVGKDRLKQVSGLRDFSFMIEVRGEGTIKVISIVNQIGRGRWDTVPRSNAWLTIVRRNGSQVNDPRDFSVSIPVRGSETLELLMENDGTLANNRGRLLLSITWDNGEVTEETLTW